jgi:hypothetical protein
MSHLLGPSALFHPGTADDYRFPHFPSPESLGDSTPLASSGKQQLPLPAMYPGSTDLSLGPKSPWWGHSGPLSLGQDACHARTAPLGVSPTSPSVSMDEHLPLPPPAFATRPQGSSSAFPGCAHPVSQSQWWPFGYTQLLPPASTALGLDLGMSMSCFYRTHARLCPAEPS